MKADHLKEAQSAVDRIAGIDLELGYELTSGHQTLAVFRGGSTTTMYLSREVAQAALKLQKDALRKRRAELVRRLNQLGVVL